MNDLCLLTLSLPGPPRATTDDHVGPSSPQMGFKNKQGRSLGECRRIEREPRGKLVFLETQNQVPGDPPVSLLNALGKLIVDELIVHNTSKYFSGTFRHHNKIDICFSNRQ